MSGPSGRSPYPSRSARTSLQNTSRLIDPSATSPHQHGRRHSFSISRPSIARDANQYANSSSNMFEMHNADNSGSSANSLALELSVSTETNMSFVSSIATSTQEIHGKNTSSSTRGNTDVFDQYSLHGRGVSTVGVGDDDTLKYGRNISGTHKFNSQRRKENPLNKNANNFETSIKKDEVEYTDIQENNKFCDRVAFDDFQCGEKSHESENMYIRCLAQKALYSHTSNNTAAFFASILYSRSKSPEDALLYAKALAAKEEKKRAILLLERSGLLPKFDICHKPVYSIKDPKTMNLRSCIEASLLASQCLFSAGEYEEAAVFLEEACRFPPPFSQESINASLVIDDASDPRLMELSSLLTAKIGEIHPVAMICCARGKTYNELSNPIKSTSWLKAALKIDSFCVEAFDYLFDHHLLPLNEEISLVEELNWKNEIEHYWLKDYYNARLHPLSRNAMEQPKEVSLINEEQSSKMDDLNNSISNVRSNGYRSPPMLIDASAIQMTQTSMHLFQATPKDKISAKKEYESSSLMRLLKDHRLSESPLIISLHAHQAYASHHIQNALHQCHKSQSIDPLNPSIIFVYAATLFALNQKRELFHLAHVIVNANPKFAVGWFVVACYYMTCQKYEVAQRHFCRATRLDPKCAEAWIGFGCAFAAADEADQALASFRAAHRLYKGSHIPLLYMGMEYLRTNHLSLANHFLENSGKMNSFDPLSFNELGVCAFRVGNYSEAINLFVHALRLCVRLDESERSFHIGKTADCNVMLDGEGNATPGITNEDKDRKNTTNVYSADGGQSLDVSKLSGVECVLSCRDSFWEPTVYNLGQSYRKIRDFDKAAFCFEKAISFCPGNASTYAALGFTKHLLGDIDGAIETYHQALGMKPDDTFSGEMLKRALQEALDSPNPLLNTDDKIGKKTIQKKSFAPPLIETSFDLKEKKNVDNLKGFRQHGEPDDMEIERSKIY